MVGVRARDGNLSTVVAERCEAGRGCKGIRRGAKLLKRVNGVQIDSRCSMQFPLSSQTKSWLTHRPVKTSEHYINRRHDEQVIWLRKSNTVGICIL